MTAACLSSLLGTAPTTSLAFASELLESADSVLRETAAIALGESRLPDGFAALAAAAERAVLSSDRRSALLGLSLLRSEQAHAHLLQLVAEASEPVARLAIEALAVFRHDEALRERVLQASAHHRSLTALAREAFGEA